MAICDGCSVDYEEAIYRFYNNESDAITFFREHGVIPVKMDCPRCKAPCTHDQNRYRFRCNRATRDKRHKRQIRCNFTQSVFKGTWLDQSHVKVHDNLRFINVFLRQWFKQSYVHRYIGWNPETAVKWRSYATEVCEFAVNNFGDQLGGEGVVVEMDEFQFGLGRFGRASARGFWVFGAIETTSKKYFVLKVPDRNAETILPIIQDRVKQGSIIHTQKLGNYGRLSALGYTHRIVNHSDSEDSPHVDTENVKRIWMDVKLWVLRQTGVERNFEKHFARYIFCARHRPEKRLHAFLIAASLLYPMAI